MSSGSKSIKRANIPWLVSIVLLDSAIVAWLSGADLTHFKQWAIMRGASGSLLPVLILLITAAIPAHIKAILVYWKMRNPLPGSAAFTRYGPADHRVDMSELKKNVGQWPVEPSEQNSFWYRLYKHVQSDAAVSDAHGTHLLSRDLAVLSLLLVVTIPILCAMTVGNAAAVLKGLGIFILQFALAALAARNSGIRLVTTVLAINSAKKMPGVKPKAAVKKKAAPPEA